MLNLPQPGPAAAATAIATTTTTTTTTTVVDAAYSRFVYYIYYSFSKLALFKEVFSIDRNSGVII